MLTEILVNKTLADLNIKYDITKHPAVFTVEEAIAIDELNIGYGCKNLFLKDRKGSKFFLVVLSQNKRVNLKDLQKKLSSSPLSFASEEKLYHYLKLTKGSVTPFGILNDINHEVELVFDKNIINENYLGFHPNVNTATVWISFKDLEKVIEKCGNKVHIIEIWYMEKGCPNN